MVLAVPLEYAKSCFRLILGGGGLGINSIFVDSVCQAVMFVVVRCQFSLCRFCFLEVGIQIVTKTEYSETESI